MSVSLTAMEVLALGNFLEGLGTYTTVAEAATALAMTGTEGAGLAGVAYSVAGGAAAATSSAAGLTEIITLAEAANLEATGISVATSGIGLLEGGVGSYEAAGLLGISSPIVAAAVAPILGVSIGALMYQENPSLWKKISMTLLPFCYEGTDVVPTWAEVANDSWILSVPKALVEALKNLFIEEGIDPEQWHEVVPSTYQGVTYNFSKPSVGDIWNTWTDPEEVITGVSGDVAILIGEITPTNIVRYVVGNGSISVARRNGSYPSTTIAPSTVNPQGANPNPSGYSTMPNSEITVSPQDVYMNGDHGAPYTPGIPEGMGKWQGTTPTEIPESKPAVINPDGTTQPMVPISVPYEVPDVGPGESVPSPDPEEQPDPTVTDNPEKQVDPYIMPYPVPWEVINPDAEIDPEIDPSQEPAKPIETPDIPESVLPDIIPFPEGISPYPTMPTTPMAFASNVGLVTVYHPTPAQLYDFERWLWVTLANADINTVWNNPFDGVITLFELYCTPTDVGTRTIHSGFLDSGINSAVISRYTEINCGTLGIPEYYGNYFDYSPYSKAHIYLPFIGIQELNVDDIVGHVVNVTYRIDEYNGSCIAMITVAKVTEVNGDTVEYSNTMYQFSGNCSVELPISGGSQASIKAGLMQANAYQHASEIAAGAQMIGGVASLIGGIIGLSAGAIGGGISQMVGAGATAAYGQAAALSHMLSGKSTVQKSGTFGASHGALGIKRPFITITRPKQIQVPNYNELYGFPAHKRVMVNACTGFLRCREVHVVSSTASEAEKSVIESMMKSGVYVTE